MSQSPPFAAGIAHAPPESPSGSHAVPPPLRGRGRGRSVGRTANLRRGQLAALGAGVVVLGSVGAWLAFGSGGGTDSGSAPAASLGRRGATASPSISGSASAAGATRNPFAGVPGAAGGATADTGSTTAGSTNGSATTGTSGSTATAPVGSTSTAAPIGSTSTSTTAPQVTVTATVTATSTVTVSPSPSPSAIYVFLYGWTSSNFADFRVNDQTAQVGSGTTFDGVTYVRQEPPDSGGRTCATVRLADAGSDAEQTLCPGDVVRLR